jgi:hypothetical protein
MASLALPPLFAAREFLDHEPLQVTAGLSSSK